MKYSSGNIADRLRGSVRMQAYHGDVMERNICGKQMLEAADAIDRLKYALEVIAGKRQQADNLLSNVEVAQWALRELK